MKKLIAITTLSLLTTGILFAQDVTPTKKVMPSRDIFMLEFGYAGWANTPDSIHTKGFGRNFNAYILYDFPIKKSHFSFAAGLGVRSDNIFLDDQYVLMNKSASEVSFINMDSATALSYKKYKLTTAYIEAPFELRFFGNKANRNRGFKAALGMKIGLLVNAHTKARESLAGPYINDKVSTKRYVQTWSFAPSFRMGWGNFSIYGQYNMSQLFNAGQGPQVYPFSIGLCISGL